MWLTVLNMNDDLELRQSLDKFSGSEPAPLRTLKYELLAAGLLLWGAWYFEAVHHYNAFMDWLFG